MPIYTATGPFVNASAPGISSTFLNAVESQLSAVQYGYNILASPYALTINGTLSNGSTNTYTCTGGATGVTSGAKAVYIHVFFTPSSAGTSGRLTPHGTAWVAGLWPEVGESANATNIVAGSVLVPVDSGGQIDLLAHGGNLAGLYVGIGAFIY